MKRARRPDGGFTISELLLVLVIVLIVGAMMTPFIRYSRIKREKIECANNLREIGLAMYIYAREHDGEFPPAVKTLYEERYLADSEIMDCRASKKTGTPDAPDYLYTGGLSVRSPALDYLVRDKADNHPGGKNVLFVNGSVEWKD